MSERTLFDRVKKFLRPLKTRAQGKAKLMVADLPAALQRDPVVGATLFRGAMAQTLLRGRATTKARETPRRVQGDR